MEEDQELAPVDGVPTVHLRRKEQPLVDRIIQGDEPGHYFLLTGPKVRSLMSDIFSMKLTIFFWLGFWFVNFLLTPDSRLKDPLGKTSMILDAMKPIAAEGVALCDVHPDLEVLRLRLGKAINFEYNEDTQTGLFSRRDPREGTSRDLFRIMAYSILGGPALDIERGTLFTYVCCGEPV